MAVDLSDLVEVLQREVSPPGTDLFPSATEDEFLGNLQDSFWEAKLFGFFSNYTESEAIVVPISGTDEFPRDQQQLTVLFAGARILRNELRNLNTSFRAQAGPVEFEQEKSATILKSLLDDVRARIVYLLTNLNITQTYYIDSILERGYSIDARITEFTTGSGYGSGYNGGYGSWRY